MRLNGIETLSHSSLAAEAQCATFYAETMGQPGPALGPGNPRLVIHERIRANPRPVIYKDPRPSASRDPCGNPRDPRPVIKEDPRPVIQIRVYLFFARLLDRDRERTF
jgi:hypothetical protein